jgi:hypothetical protein
LETQRAATVKQKHLHQEQSLLALHIQDQKFLSPVASLFVACDVERRVVLQYNILLTLKAAHECSKLCELLLLSQDYFYRDVCCVLQHQCCIQKVHKLDG